MEKRKIIIGDYDTAVHGWTLTGWQLDPAVQKTKYKDKPNGDGSWDLSTALTDGIPRYNDRNLTVTLELSEGNRMVREEIIRELVNKLDGMREEIKLPDDDTHYVVGRIHVAREFNNLAHAAITITATCEPWRYACAETVVILEATAEKQSIRLTNRGKRAVVPKIEVSGGSVLFEYGNASLALSASPYPYPWSELLLTTGGHVLTYSGGGSATITYREAVLE